MEVPVKVSHSASRGYYFMIPASASPLPRQFIQSVLNKRNISCSTEHLNSLSDRANEAITQALTITHELIHTLLSHIREDIDSLFALADSVVEICLNDQTKYLITQMHTLFCSKGHVRYVGFVRKPDKL